MIVPVMVISNLVLTRQIYSEETTGAHAHYREPVPLKRKKTKNVIKREKISLLGLSGFADWFVEFKRYSKVTPKPF